MLDLSFGMKKESELINEAVKEALENGIVTEDINNSDNFSTSEVGDWIAKKVRELYLI